MGLKPRAPLVRVVHDGLYQCRDKSHERDYQGRCIVGGCDRSEAWVASQHFPVCARCKKKFAVSKSSTEDHVFVSRSGFREEVKARPIPEYCHRCTRHLMYGRNPRPDPISDAEWQAIINKHGGRCAYCGVEGSLTRDHDVPVPSGGKSDASNIVPACLLCNSRKGSKTGTEYRAWLRFSGGLSRIHLAAG